MGGSESLHRGAERTRHRARPASLVRVLRTCSLAALFVAPVASLACATHNSPPIVNSLSAERDVVLTSESCRLCCEAVDFDDDELTYVWSSTAGDVCGDGAAAVWTDPGSEGIYRVNVRVLDSNCDEAIAFVNIAVRANHPPCELTCSAKDQDNDELEFEWSAEAGLVTGVGAVVTWTAPDVVGLYEIVVVVATDTGDRTRGRWI